MKEQSEQSRVIRDIVQHLSEQFSVEADKAREMHPKLNPAAVALTVVTHTAGQTLAYCAAAIDPNNPEDFVRSAMPQVMVQIEAWALEILAISRKAKSEGGQ